MKNVTSLTASGDYVALPNEEHYRIYFDQIRTVSKVLRNWAEGKMGEESPEAKCITAFGDRILQTVELLRLKYLAEGEETLKLDLNESGFPHFNEIVSLENDATHASADLRSVPPRAMATEDALEHLFKHREIPSGQLHHLARRHFLEELREQDFLKPFELGEITLLRSDKHYNDYACTWACYNAEDNLVYLHLLEFQQNLGAPSLELSNVARKEFIDVLKQQGNRAAPLVVLATGIDEAIDAIHPKVLRRIRIGPVLSSRFSFDECELSQFLRREGDPDDLIFSLESEVIVSSRQIIKDRGWLFLPNTLREVFSVPPEDPECFDRRLSELHRFLFMPHRLWQTSTAQENPPWLTNHTGAKRIAYNISGEAVKL